MTIRACRFLFGLVVLSALPAFAAAAEPAHRPDARAWPTAYAPADISLAQLLAKSRAALGHPEPRDTYRITYRIRREGLDGVEHDTWRGDDYLTATTIGPFHTLEGRLGGRSWQQNENGYTTVMSGVHVRSEANADALAGASNASAGVTLLGRLRAPADVYVVRVAPANGREERRFYDAATFHVVRSEIAFLGRTVVAEYDDYRTQSGITRAWHTKIGDGRAADDSDYSVTALQVGAPVDDAEIAIPPDRRNPVLLPAGAERVRIPVSFLHDRFIVRLDVNGRGLDFELDSGALGILIDREVADQLHLTPYGRRTDTTAGSYTSVRVIVPRIAIGGITMSDVVATAAPFHQQGGRDTKIVGLLGYDFLAGCVVQLDYERGEAFALQADGFRPPPNALGFDARLDDRVPVVPMAVNGAIGRQFILDTGSDLVVMFPAFADAHPGALKDSSSLQWVSTVFNVVQADGVGGKLRLHATVLKDMIFGNVVYHDQLTFVLSRDQPDFAGEDLDGLVGSSLLDAYVVWFDYPHRRVWLAPNGRTHQLRR